MRHVVTALILLLACPGLQAQTPRPTEVHRHALRVENELRQLESEVGVLSQGLRRDAFIVVQLMAAASELDDFQHNVALDKSLYRIREARRVAGEKPKADDSTILLLDGLLETLRISRDQSFSNDQKKLRKDLQRGGALTQREIFRDLNQLRRIRQLYGDLQKRTGETIIDFDDALVQALSAAFGLLDAEAKE